MSLLRRLVDDWFADFHVRRIREYLGARPEGEFFDWRTAAIYRLPLTDAIDVEVRVDGVEEPIRFSRHLGDLAGLRTRCYVVDSKPLAMFAKPIAVVAFGPFDDEPGEVRFGQAHVRVNDEPFPFFHGRKLRGLAVYNRNVVADVWAAPVGAPIQATLPPLTGTFPPTDRPNGSTPPTNGTPPPFGGGVLLFYGICLQNPIAVSHPGFAGDPLWIQTHNLSLTFKARGYRTYTILAGTEPAGEPTPDVNVNTLAAAWAALAADLALQTAFCNSPADQLVIFIAGHGYSGASNPTGQRALKFNPSAGTNDFVSHHDLTSVLAGVPQVTASPTKTYIMVFGCRTGGLFDDGVLDGRLQGAHLVTATTSGSELTDGVGAGNVFRQALQMCDGSWTSFVDWSKHLAGAAGVPRPRNGDVKGCRVGVTLTTVDYGGADIGARWSCSVKIDAVTSAPTLPPLNFAPGNAVNAALYDRFFDACPPLTLAALPVTITAIHQDPQPDRGTASNSTAALTCDGTTSAHALAVAVNDGVSTAQLTFNFQITPTCIP